MEDYSSKYMISSQGVPNNVQSTVSNPVTNTQNEVSAENTPVVDGDKKTMDMLKWTGVVVAGVLLVGGTAFASKKLKGVKLTDINFEKGIASLKDGEKFSGVVRDTLKNGDKITLKYKDGVLAESTRKGSESFKKTFEYIGGKLSKVLQSGDESAEFIYKYGTKDELSKIIKNGKEIDVGKLIADADELKEREKLKIGIEAALRFFDAEHAKEYAANMQEKYFSAVDSSCGKSAKESAEFFSEQFRREVSEEAVRRTKSEEAAAIAASKAQEKYAAMFPQSGKDVKESARFFMSPFERLDDIVSSEAAADSSFKNADFVKKYFKPETIDAMSDEQLVALTGRMGDEADFANVAKFLEENFTPDNVRKISETRYDSTFVGNLFDAVIYRPNEAQKIIDFYHRLK